MFFDVQNEVPVTPGPGECCKCAPAAVTTSM